MLLQSSMDKHLCDLLMYGAIGVLPTDTLYGLVCRAADERAVQKLYALKHREAKPGTIIVASAEQLIELGLNAPDLDRAAAYWPGPISVLIPATEPKLAYLTQGLPELACRIVAAPPELIELLQTTGPLLTSSANQPGEPPAATIDEARQYFSDSVDFYIGGGDKSTAEPSTLIRPNANQPEILRHGAGTIEPKENPPA